MASTLAERYDGGCVAQAAHGAAMLSVSVAEYDVADVRPLFGGGTARIDAVLGGPDA